MSADVESPMIMEEEVGFEETVVSSEDDPSGNIREGTRLMVARNAARGTKTDESYIDDSKIAPADGGIDCSPGPKAGSIVSHAEFWSTFTGLKVKEFTEAELKAFERPFTLGWRREVVLRGTATTGGKKIGDVYYFGPDNKVKLRSCVEMGLYLKKHPNCGLEPENFTFARQPVYKSPLEIVRHAMARGSNQTSIPEHASIIERAQAAVQASDTPPVETRRPATITPSSSIDESGEGSTLLEGRAKRKRVAPTRFEDEDYLEASPFKKKEKTGQAKQSTPSPLVTNLTSRNVCDNKTPNNRTGVVIRINRKPLSDDLNKTSPAQNQTPKQAHLQLSQHKGPIKISGPQPAVKQVAPVPNVSVKPQTVVKTEKTDQDDQKTTDDKSKKDPSSRSSFPNILQRKLTTPGPSTPEKGTNIVTNGNAKPSESVSNSTYKLIKPKPTETGNGNLSNLRPIKPKVSSSQNAEGKSVPQPPSITIDTEAGGDKAMAPPCSIMCGDGQMPDLLCSRCLCLFHRSCVPSAIFLSSSGQFICPNCIQPTDQGTKVSEKTSANDSSVEASSQQQTKSLMNGKDKPVGQPLVSKQPPSLTKIFPINVSQNSSTVQNVSLLQSHLTQGQTIRKGFVPILPKPPSMSSSLTNTHIDVTDRHRSQLKLLQSFQQQAGKTLSQVDSYPHGSHTRPKISADVVGQVKPFITKGAKPLTRVPLFGKQRLPPKIPMGAFKSIPSGGIMTGKGTMSKGQHQQMSQMIQKQLQNLPRSSNIQSRTHSQNAREYRPSSIAPIAPIKVTPLQVASLLERKTKNKYRDWLLKYRSPLNQFLGTYDVLNSVLNYLSVKDLITLKMVSRSFNSLASQHHLWRNLSMKNIFISDWKHFAEDIVKPNNSDVIDFDGIKIPTGTQIPDAWKDFEQIADSLQSVRVLKFGSIPSHVIVTLIQNAATLPRLDSLCVRNILDGSLEFLLDLHLLSSLRSFKIGAKNGFRATPIVTPQFLEQSIGELKQLTSLSITNLKGFSPNHFSFLDSLTNLKHLEVGNCELWTSVSREQNSHEDDLPAPYKFLASLKKIETLKFISITLDESALYLSSLLANLTELECLVLERLFITSDALESLEAISDTLTNMPRFRSLTVTTNDASTNRMVFDFFKRLHTLHDVTWKVGVIVEDSGECLVPLSKEESEGAMELPSEGSVEHVEVAYLTEQLENFLPRTKVLIQPQ